MGARGALRVVALCVPLALGGCAALGGGGPAPDTYDLTAGRSFGSAAGATRAQLVVMKPRAVSALDSRRIMVREDGRLISFFSGAQWTDDLTTLVQARLAQAFENSGRIRAVGQQGDGLKADYLLVSEIRNFEMDTDGARTADVSIVVKIINDRNGRVVASELFEGSAAVPSDSPDGAVAGLDAAFSAVQGDIVAWTLARI